MPDAILFPVAGHLALIFFLYLMVSWHRNRAVSAEELVLDELAQFNSEPERSRRWAKNLNNQFELPCLFYALIALLYASGSVTMTQVLLAWLFLIGRIAHTAVQTMSDNVTARGLVFSINFAALCMMWIVFLSTRWGLQ